MKFASSAWKNNHFNLPPIIWLKRHKYWIACKCKITLGKLYKREFNDDDNEDDVVDDDNPANYHHRNYENEIYTMMQCGCYGDCSTIITFLYSTADFQFLSHFFFQF